MPESQTNTLKDTQVNGEIFYQISNVDKMAPFLMSIVSDSNHWMFISSNGGLTAGRKNAEHALFPYYTDDKLAEFYDITGSKSVFRVTKEGKSSVWEPFAEHHLGQYRYSRNLYKNYYGNKVIFEEINDDLGLTFRYQWNSSNLYGFVRKCELINHSGSEVTIKLLDGIQNIMPHGVSSELQVRQSNLVDAYKRNELEARYGLGIYSLSAIIVDRAEPSEALKANIAWSVGFEHPTYLLTSQQLPVFRNGGEIKTETDEKAKKAAYFISSEIRLPDKAQSSWMIVANVNQSVTDISALCKEIAQKDILKSVEDDIAMGSQRLKRLVGSSDGFQLSTDQNRNARHYSNTLFNIMRGGIFDNGYQVERWDFENYLQKANRKAESNWKPLLGSLPETIQLQDLKKIARENSDKDFTRLALEYLPLKFSRRHGDPSRPWNRFSINTRSEIDGSKILDYEGNWRDIFQNWEALVHSFPEFIDGMILKFLNASTFDGYNPYRVTKDGFDWETIEPHDPWSYIGYWGDHQVIYLLKFLEFAYAHYPARLKSYFKDEIFVYANVPYKIRSYDEILENPKDTIIFDEKLDHEIRLRRNETGADGALIRDKNHNVQRTNFVEKILVVVLAKLSNFIPEGGIWMNTQRPEWNDANNALVGNGVSMVTLYYLRRFLSFMNEVIDQHENDGYPLSEEVATLFKEISKTLSEYLPVISSGLTDEQRKKILDGLGSAGSKYRDQVYKNSFSGKRSKVTTADLREFFDLTLKYLNHSIDVNKREDGMFHAYNLMSVSDSRKEVSIDHLQEMLEGQVAVLSSGHLSAQDSLMLLDALKSSKLFRDDQYSYLLYPNKELPGFMVKNIIPEKKAESSELLMQLLADNNSLIVEKDVNGQYHFNGSFHNAGDLKEMLKVVSAKGYKDLVAKEERLVLQIFEDVFNHKAFTGRSGTFFGYEGLGSIYWHMVSKLLLAVEECCIRAVEEGESKEIIGRLMEHYYEINEGIGVHKSPKLYGAFPIDPYSHTPQGKGVQQPGMTGQVKEDILSRIGEIGIQVHDGIISFSPSLLKKSEFLTRKSSFEYPDINQQVRSIETPENAIVFTYCQVPVIYQIGKKQTVEVKYSGGDSSVFESSSLDKETSQKIFSRTGEIDHLRVILKSSQLK